MGDDIQRELTPDASSDPEFANMLATSSNNEQFREWMVELRPYMLKIACDEWPERYGAYTRPSDLVQSTCHRALQDLETVRGTTRQKFKAWLRTILIHLIQNEKKRAAKRHHGRQNSDEFDRDGCEPSPSSIAGNKEMRAIILRAIEALPAHYRDIIRMRYFEAMAWGEIGACLGKSEDAVRQLCKRAAEQIKMNVDSLK